MTEDDTYYPSPRSRHPGEDYTMASFSTRLKAGGATFYTAYTRIKQKGLVIHTESRTFPKDALAKSWAKRRETELEDDSELANSIARKKAVWMPGLCYLMILLIAILRLLNR